MLSCSVVSNSSWPHALQPARLLSDKNTGVGCHSLLPGIFLTQGLNPGLLHCTQILYCLSYQGSQKEKKKRKNKTNKSVHGILQARILEWVAIPFSRGSSWPRDAAWVSCIPGRFSTIWATRKGHWETKYALRRLPWNWSEKVTRNLSHQGNKGRVFGLKREEAIQNAEGRSPRYLMCWCQCQTPTELEAAGQNPGFSSLTGRMSRGTNVS